MGSYILEEAAEKFSSSQSEKFSTVARTVTPSEDPSDRQASPRVMGLETDLETSPGKRWHRGLSPADRPAGVVREGRHPPWSCGILKPWAVGFNDSVC